VGVLTSAGTEYPQPVPGVDVFTISCNWTCRDLGRLVRTIWAWRPDLVHVQYPTQAYGEQLAPWTLPAILKLLRIPTVQTWHEFLPHQRWLHIVVALAATRVIVVRPKYESSLTASFLRLLGRARPQLIPNAPPLEPIKLSDSDRKLTKARYAPAGKNLVVYFGFMYPHKGVEQMFEIADPRQDQLVIVGHLDSSNPYHRTVTALAEAPPWQGAATLAGYLPDAEAAALLASADAIVFPFREGMAQWNTSVSGAQMLGTLVIVTSAERSGYDAETNTYFCAPNDISKLRAALREYVGRRIPATHHQVAEAWKKIAEAHGAVYRGMLARKEKR